MKHQVPRLPRLTPLGCMLVGMVMMADAMMGHALAAGRTYQPQNADDSPKFELCRLKKRDYIDGGTNCIYARQTGGKDVVIKVDGSKIRCQPSFQCKRIK